jgi:hypothetical protein
MEYNRIDISDGITINVLSEVVRYFRNDASDVRNLVLACIPEIPVDQRKEWFKTVVGSWAAHNKTLLWCARDPERTRMFMNSFLIRRRYNRPYIHEDRRRDNVADTAEFALCYARSVKNTVAIETLLDNEKENERILC